MGKKKNETPKKTETKKPVPLPIPQDEKPFEFGGLPQRDLKKNLGC